MSSKRFTINDLHTVSILFIHVYICQITLLLKLLVLAHQSAHLSRLWNALLLMSSLISVNPNCHMHALHRCAYFAVKQMHSNPCFHTSIHQKYLLHDILWMLAMDMYFSVLATNGHVVLHVLQRQQQWPIFLAIKLQNFFIGPISVFPMVKFHDQLGKKRTDQ